MKSTIAGLIIGAIGGWLCWIANMPAPWLAGSMIAGVAAVFSGIRVDMPRWLHTLAFIFLGIQTGTSVSWDTIDRAVEWPLSIAFLGLTVTAVTWACYLFYVRHSKWDGPTALFASLPGALSLVLLLASSTQADMRRVTIAQCIRLFLLVAALPAMILLLGPPEPLHTEPIVIGSLLGLATVVGLSVAAGYGLEMLKVPAGLFIGPMLASAGLELSGLVNGAAPDSILIPTNVVLGVVIASRFAGFTWMELVMALKDGFLGFVIALAIAMTGAAITSTVAGLPFALTILAFAPGGLEAMTLMAFALELDPAYVGAHQLARYLGLAILMPMITAFAVARMDARARIPRASGTAREDDL